MKQTTALLLVISLIFVTLFSIFLVGQVYEKRAISPVITRITEENRQYLTYEPTTPIIDLTAEPYSFIE